jgi:hypothetical protein
MKQIGFLERPALAALLTLHLAPGLLCLLSFVAVGSVTEDAGIPSYLVFILCALFVLAPAELGLLYLHGRYAGPGAGATVQFREQTPGWQVVLLSAACLAWAIVVFALLDRPLTKPLRTEMFYWFPGFFDLEIYLVQPERYSRSLRILTWAIGLVAGVIVPLTEELYFRGYLLPRMRSLGAWAPLTHTALFVLYHFWSPWMFPVRMLAILPAYYAVWRTRNIRIGIAVHLLLNLVGDSLLTAPLVFSSHAVPR